MTYARADLMRLQDYTAGDRHRTPMGTYKTLEAVAEEVGLAPARVQGMLRALRSYSVLRGIASASMARRKALLAA